MYFVYGFGRSDSEQRTVIAESEILMFRLPYKAKFIIHAACEGQLVANKIRHELTDLLSMSESEAKQHVVMHDPQVYFGIHLLHQLKGIKRHYILKEVIQLNDVIFDVPSDHIIRIVAAGKTRGEAAKLSSTQKIRTYEIFEENHKDMGIHAFNPERHWHPSILKELQEYKHSS